VLLVNRSKNSKKHVNLREPFFLADQGYSMELLVFSGAELEVLLHGVEVFIELNAFQIQHQVDIASGFKAFFHFIHELLVFLA